MMMTNLNTRQQKVLNDTEVALMKLCTDFLATLNNKAEDVITFKNTEVIKLSKNTTVRTLNAETVLNFSKEERITLNTNFPKLINTIKKIEKNVSKKQAILYFDGFLEEHYLMFQEIFQTNTKIAV